MSMVDRFESMLAAGKDSALLRFSLGNEYMKVNDAKKAIRHLDVAVYLDPLYSAAWKLLGKAATQSGSTESAIVAYTAGIAAALQKGDKQAAKEMTVFMKRLTRPAGP